jgi:hypothetical protein
MSGGVQRPYQGFHLVFIHVIDHILAVSLTTLSFAAMARVSGMVGHSFLDAAVLTVLYRYRHDRHCACYPLSSLDSI